MDAAQVVMREVIAARPAVPFAPLDTAVIAAVLVGVLLGVRWQRSRIERSRPAPGHPAGAAHPDGERTEPTETAARR